MLAPGRVSQPVRMAVHQVLVLLEDLLGTLCWEVLRIADCACQHSIVKPGLVIEMKTCCA